MDELTGSRPSSCHCFIDLKWKVGGIMQINIAYHSQSARILRKINPFGWRTKKPSQQRLLTVSDVGRFVHKESYQIKLQT